MNFRLLLLAFLPAALPLPAQDTPPPTDAAANAAPATVGDPQNPDGLIKALEAAYKSGLHLITITPGTYLFPSENKTHLELHGWDHVTIQGRGVSMVLDQPQNGDKLFDLVGCSNVTIDGIYMTQNTTTSYQGHITSINRINGDYIFDWTPSVGYPNPPNDPQKLWIDTVNAQTHELASGDYNNLNSKSPDGDGYRYVVGHDTPTFHVGDFVVARYGNPPCKIHLDDSYDCTVQNVTMTNNGFAPIFESAGGGNHFLRIMWSQGPKPAGATEDPLVTNAADGIHCANSNPGPDIEGCVFQGIFLDDCIAIHGGYQSIVNAHDSTLTVQNGYAYFQAGEPARISDDKGFYLQALVTSVHDNGNGTSTVVIDSHEHIPYGCKASNPRRDGQGYRIIGNKLGHTRSRGIIAKADNGIIRDNVIEYCSLPIRLGAEWGAGEADYSQNVVVENNTMSNNGMFNGGYILPCVMADGSGSEENLNITIENNHFNSNYSGDVGINWADTVVVKGNFFSSPAQWTHDGSRAPVYVANSRNVQVTGNHVDPAGIYKKPLVASGDNVSNLQQDESSPAP